jgi:serine/threonine protein kinase
MAEHLNPFIYGKPVPPSHFVGREEVIRKCYTQLAGPVRGRVAIYGEPGVGKTSLLHYVMHLARAEGWGQPHVHYIYVYLYCPTLDQFTATRFWQCVLKEITEQEEESAIIRQRIDQLLEEQEIQITQIQHFLRGLEKQGLALILLLDGFDWIVRTDTATRAEVGDFLSYLRALTNDPDCSLALVTASRQQLNELCHDIVKERPESEFYNGFIFQHLSTFSQAEVAALMEQARQAAGFEPTPAECGLVERLAGAYPALLQMAGHLLFEKRRAGSLSEQGWAALVEDFEREARTYFSRFWNGSSLLEQTLLILCLLLRLPGEYSLQTSLPKREIQALLQRYERDLVQLAERGLLHSVHEHPCIFSSIFAWWITREIAAEERAAASRHPSLSQEPFQRAWEAIEKLAPQYSLDKRTQILSIGPARPPEESLPIPSRYQVLGEIARGASGVVYKALDTILNRSVAVKVLRADFVGLEPQRHGQLLQEARTASRLHHANIVTIYDVIEECGQIILIMEYVEGEPLDKRVGQGGLPLSQVVALLEQAAAALDYAHLRGIIHRDIKPANLVITDDGVLKLADFGIASASGARIKTDAREVQGTVMYMSPEQLVVEPGEQGPPDHRSDLFSLAVVAFEMLTGELPWHGKTAWELMGEIAASIPRSITEFNIPAAAKLEPVFRKAMARDPAERYQRGKDFAADLKEIVKYSQLQINGKRRAVLIGVNTYEDSRNYPDLPVCINDIGAICDRLLAGGFDARDVRLLTDDTPKPPTYANISAALQSLANEAGQEDLLLVYFSGHGDVCGDESYLIARDSYASMSGRTAVPITWIKEIMEQATARAKVIILDACYSGANLKAKGGAAMSPEYLHRVFEDARGFVVLASCMHGERSFLWTDQQLSVFTYFLVEAIRGQADLDRKGFVTIQDVNRYVTNGVRSWAESCDLAQTPTLEFRVAGDIALVSSY